MKVIFLAILLCGAVLLSGISIFQIQFTTDSGRDNTFPSKYVGKTVTVEGIVTATGYKSGGFFISEPAGGAWRSIYIRSTNSNLKQGDKVIIRGSVDEYYGMTCIQNVSKITIIDSHHPLPFANLITSGQITTPEQAEAYECTLVKVQNTTCIQSQMGSSKLMINDGSGQCCVGDQLVSEPTRQYKSGALFNSLVGIVCYAYGDYTINPRSKADVSVMVPVFNQNRSWGKIKSIYK
jgi:predicted extracellular nuclease